MTARRADSTRGSWKDDLDGLPISNDISGRPFSSRCFVTIAVFCAIEAASWDIVDGDISSRITLLNEAIVFLNRYDADIIDEFMILYEKYTLHRLQSLFIFSSTNCSYIATSSHSEFQWLNLLRATWNSCAVKAKADVKKYML